MKMTRSQKKTGREIGARASVRAAAPRDAETPLEAAADRQIAEVERTFTLRYEW